MNHQSIGALLHLHGGGFVIGSAMGQNDERLLRHAEALC
jgi:acetyl esterase/lipase